MRRDRVLVLAHQYVPAHPRVRNELDAIEAAGLEADVVCLRGKGEAARARYGRARLYRLPVKRHRGAGLAVYVAEYLVFGLLAALLGGWLCLRRRHVLVLSHSLPDPLVFAAALPRLLGARVVLNMHEFTPELFQTRYGLSARDPLIRLTTLLERASCAFAHRVLTVHEPGAALLASRGVPDEKLRVVTNTAELPTSESGQVKRRRDRDGDDFWILYHGTVGNEYDLMTVLDALARLSRTSTGERRIRLRIVGDGPELPTLRARTAELGLGDDVVFEPPVPFARVPELLAGADIGAALMRDRPYAHLGLPTKLLECVQAGLPVLTTPGRTIRHYLPLTAACYVPFGDAAAVADVLRRLLADHAWKDRMADEARRALAPTRPAEVRRRYIEVLHAEGARGPRPAMRVRGSLLSRSGT